MVPISAAVSYIEIGVSDASKSRAFLEQMFNWKFHPFGQGAEGWFRLPPLRPASMEAIRTRGFSCTSASGISK